MIGSILSAILALLGLGLLVFIHELGHYIIARRRGMKVEVFAIGFGKPIYSWQFQGVKWQICCLPFGGYVKIAGMQREGEKEPYEIPNGFYEKPPLSRIQVALAGPLVNIAFAFFCFVLLWAMGGRLVSFADYTHLIGSIDPKSALFAEGVRPGDRIETYNHKPFTGFKDLLIAELLKEKEAQISGYTIDEKTGRKTSFDYTLPTYTLSPSSRGKIHTIGILSPASYLIYQDSFTPSVPSSMTESGILPKDRLVWVDGEKIFSLSQLSSLINESSAFLTVKRGESIFQTKVSRVHLEELSLSSPVRGEIDDWQHEAHLSSRLSDLYFIPYILSPDCVVEGSLSFIDEEDEKKAGQICQRCSYFVPLQEEDQILAVDGTPISTPSALLSALQTRHVLVIVERNPDVFLPVSWKRVDHQFEGFGAKNLQTLVASIGIDPQKTSVGKLHLLKPVVPIPFSEYPFTPEQRKGIEQTEASYKKHLESLTDPEQKKEVMRAWEKQQKRAILGVSFFDRKVIYNPNPFEQFSGVFQETGRGLYGLFSGGINPKYLSGPVGIVHIVHNSWMVGAKEGLYWLAVISLNLGLLNLLPIPVLDGGHIVFALWEAVTKKRLKAKTMERLVFPFVGLLIAFFIYVTYQDISRLLSHLFF